MHKALEVVCTLIGGLTVLASVSLLFFARLLPMLWIVGGATLLVGFSLFSLARSGRTWPARGVLAVLVLAVLGLCQTAPHWLAYVYAGNGGANVEPSVEAPAIPDHTPVVQVAEGSGTKTGAGNAKPAAADSDEKEITLDQLLKDHIEPALKAISAKKGYICTFKKCEWCKGLIGGLRLTDELCTMKVRHEPFSVYLRFEQKNKLGTEAIFVEGKNDGNVIAHSTTFLGKLAGTIRVPPTDPKVMADNRYPITNIGMRNLLLKIQKQGKEFEDELKGFGFTVVQDRKIDSRPCTCIEFYNPKPSPRVPMVSARLYLDQEWKVPVGFESYENRGGRAELVEYYRYTKITFDPEFKDDDFDPSNPKYGYPR